VEVIKAREAAIVAEAARVTVVRAAVASTQEVAAARESITALVRDAEDPATLAKREA
jgi:hypothetical protein